MGKDKWELVSRVGTFSSGLVLHLGGEVPTLEVDSQTGGVLGLRWISSDGETVLEFPYPVGYRVFRDLW